MSDIDVHWEFLAERIARQALAKSGLDFASVITRLQAIGVEETKRALIVRFARKALRLEHFLQYMGALPIPTPELWAKCGNDKTQWHKHPNDILFLEMSAVPWLSLDSLALRLSELGVDNAHARLTKELATGKLPLARFLQCLAVMKSDSLSGYVSHAEFVDTFLASSQQSTPNHNSTATKHVT